MESPQVIVNSTQRIQTPPLDDRSESRQLVPDSPAGLSSFQDGLAILAEPTTSLPSDPPLSSGADTGLVIAEDRGRILEIPIKPNGPPGASTLAKSTTLHSSALSSTDIKLVIAQGEGETLRAPERVAFALPPRIVSFPESTFLPKGKEIGGCIEIISCPPGSFPQCSTRLRKPLRNRSGARDGAWKTISPKIEFVGTEQTHIWEDISDSGSVAMSLDSTDDDSGEDSTPVACPIGGSTVVDVPSPEFSEITRDEFESAIRNSSSAASVHVCHPETLKPSRESCAAVGVLHSEVSETIRAKLKAFRESNSSPADVSRQENLGIIYDLGVDLLEAYSSSQRRRVMQKRHDWYIRWLAENNGCLPQPSPTDLTRRDPEYHRLRERKYLCTSILTILTFMPTVADREPHNREFYNAEAARRIYTLNNNSRKWTEIDLHLLKVSEAMICFRLYVYRVWDLPKASHFDLVTVIVGRGTHSPSGIARLPKAIQEVCRQLGLFYYAMEGHMVVKLIRECARGHGGPATLSEMFAGCSASSINVNANRFY